MLAVPLSASCHEYEQYVPGEYCGPSCTPYNNLALNITMIDYVEVLFDVLRDDDLFVMDEEGNSRFLGMNKSIIINIIFYI